MSTQNEELPLDEPKLRRNYSRIECIIHVDTGKAILVHTEELHPVEVWIPLSQVDYLHKSNQSDLSKGEYHDVIHAADWVLSNNNLL